jgi:hypothetical protein
VLKRLDGIQTTCRILIILRSKVAQSYAAAVVYPSSTPKGWNFEAVQRRHGIFSKRKKQTPSHYFASRMGQKPGKAEYAAEAAIFLNCEYMY